MWLPRLAVMSVLISCAAAPPAPADFSGNWTLSAAKSDFGRANAPQSLTMTVKQSGTQLAVESKLVDGRGASTSAYTLDLTGKEAENTMRGARVLSVSAWRGTTLHVKAKTQIQGAEIKTVDQWQLGESRRVLTIYRTATTPNGEVEQRFVYEKNLDRP